MDTVTKGQLYRFRDTQMLYQVVDILEVDMLPPHGSVEHPRFSVKMESKHMGEGEAYTWLPHKDYVLVACPINPEEQLNVKASNEVVNPRQYLEEFLSKPPVEASTVPGGVERMKEILSSGAVKFDAGKAPLSMIPLEALTAEAQVFAFGAKKYGKSNYKSGMTWTRVIDAALRHINAYASGEDKDPESGMSHLAHAKCCLSMLIFYAENKKGTDDRG